MFENNIHPFDISEISKGDYISPETISRRSGIPITAKKYRLVVLAWKNKIESQWPDFHGGETVWTKTEGDPPGIRILTDNEGSRYGNTRMNSHFRAIRKTTDTYVNMDTSQLDEEGHLLRNRNINLGTIVSGKLKSAMDAERRRMLTEPANLGADSE